ELAPIPIAHFPDKLELGRPALLADQVDLVSQLHQRGGKVRVVDVRAGSAEQIAMENQHPHAHEPNSAGWVAPIGSAIGLTVRTDPVETRPRMRGVTVGLVAGALAIAV